MSDSQKQKIPCQWCGKSSIMMETMECDSCWELRSRIKQNPELARKILNSIKK